MTEELKKLGDRWEGLIERRAKINTSEEFESLYSDAMVLLGDFATLLVMPSPVMPPAEAPADKHTRAVMLPEDRLLLSERTHLYGRLQEMQSRAQLELEIAERDATIARLRYQLTMNDLAGQHEKARLALKAVREELESEYACNVAKFDLQTGAIDRSSKTP